MGDPFLELSSCSLTGPCGLLPYQTLQGYSLKRPCSLGRKLAFQPAPGSSASSNLESWAKESDYMFIKYNDPNMVPTDTMGFRVTMGDNMCLFGHG